MFTRVFPQRILERGITPSESHLEYFRAPRRRSIRGSAKSIARSREDPFHSIATLVDVRSPSLRQLFTEMTRVPPDPLLSFLSLFLARCARTLLQLPGVLSSQLVARSNTCRPHCSRLIRDNVAASRFAARGTVPSSSFTLRVRPPRHDRDYERVDLGWFRLRVVLATEAAYAPRTSPRSRRSAIAGENLLSSDPTEHHLRRRCLSTSSRGRSTVVTAVVPRSTRRRSLRTLVRFAASPSSSRSVSSSANQILFTAHVAVPRKCLAVR